jgi:hypothetical protein
MLTLTRLLKRRWIIDYLQATDNEILFDLNDYRFLKIDPAVCGYLPRPTKWVSRVDPYFNLSKLVWLFTAFFWRFGGATLFHFAQFLYWYAYSRFRVQKDAKVQFSEGFALALSSRASEVIHPHNMQNVPISWITFPWAPVDRLPTGSRRIDVFSLLNGRDLLRAFLNSVAATRSQRRRKGAALWLLHSYTAFRWFAVREAIEKLDGHLVMAEHYDRWAILVDSVVLSQTRRDGRKANNGRLVLVQHGRVAGFGNAEQTALHIDLKRRLKAVSELHVYDKQSEQIFGNAVLTASCMRRGVQVKYFNPRVTLQETDDQPEGTIQVLFVGHPACENLHAFVLKNLKPEYAIKAYYKPHPLMPMGAELFELDWTVIQDKSYFPSVNFLVSYPSTLVVEYASCGIPAAMHPIDLAKENWNEYMQEVRSYAKAHAAT